MFLLIFVQNQAIFLSEPIKRWVFNQNNQSHSMISQFTLDHFGNFVTVCLALLVESCRPMCCKIVSLFHLHQKDSSPIYVIDEIGKMELFSQGFIQAVRKLIDQPNATILGTIPVPKGRLLGLVEEVRSRPDVQVFTVCLSIWKSEQVY